MLTVRTMTKADKKAVKRFYKACHYNARFIGNDACYFIEHEQNILASVIVSTIETTPFLHALVVDENYQRQGLSRLLINHCLNTHLSLVCFADQKLTDFYQKLGFKALPPPQFTDRSYPTDLIRRFQSYLVKQPELLPFTVTRYRNLTKADVKTSIVE